jgi:hypothetical protein
VASLLHGVRIGPFYMPFTGGATPPSDSVTLPTSIRPKREHLSRCEHVLQERLPLLSMCPPYKLGSSLAASILHLFHRDLLLPDVTPSLDPSESFLPVQKAGDMKSEKKN